MASVKRIDELSMEEPVEKVGVNHARQASPLLITPVSGSSTHD